MKCQNCGGVEWRYENTETICKKCATVIENNNIGTDQFVRITWLDIQPTRISPKMTDASGNVIPSATKKMFTRLRRQDSRMKNTRTEKKIHECLQTLDSRIFGEHTYVTYESQKVLKYIDKCQKLKSLKKE